MDAEEYYNIFRQHGRESPPSQVYIESVDARIDASLADLIENINTKTRFTTESSCSGVIDDHFDISAIQDAGVKMCDEPEFIYEFNDIARTEVSISLVDEWHSIQSDECDPPFETEVVVDGEFYDIQDALESIIVEYEDGYGFPVHMEYSRKMIPQYATVYIRIPVISFLRTADSFDEYDAKVQSLIAMLEDVLLNLDSVVDGDWPSLRYDLDGQFWYDEDRTF